MFNYFRTENTLTAYRQAVELGCDMLELDVNLSKVEIGNFLIIFLLDCLKQLASSFFKLEILLQFIKGNCVC